MNASILHSAAEENEVCLAVEAYNLLVIQFARVVPESFGDKMRTQSLQFAAASC